jgi:hypothetical protein
MRLARRRTAGKQLQHLVRDEAVYHQGTDAMLPQQAVVRGQDAALLLQAVIERLGGKGT